MRKRFSIASLSMFSVFCALAQVDAGPDQEVCGTSATLQANVPGPGESGFWSCADPGVSFIDNTDPLTTVNGLSFGENDLMWAYITPAGATSDVVSIWAYDPAAPVASAGPDQTITGPPYIAIMGASGCSVFPCTCQWVVVAGTVTITDPTDPNTTMTGFGIGTTTLTWYCNNGGCGSSSDQIAINTFSWTGIDEHSGQGSSVFTFDPSSRLLRTVADAIVDEIAVSDARGRFLPMNTLSSKNNTWDMGDQASGIYVIKAIVNGQAHVSRFIVAKL